MSYVTPPVVATIGRKNDGITIDNLVPHISNVDECDKVEGDWDDDHQLCMLMKGPDAGWTAPIHGAYVWYNVSELMDATGDEDLEGEYMVGINACLVAQSPFYPTFAGACTPIMSQDDENIYDNEEEALEAGMKLIHEFVEDIREGNEDFWFLKYVTPTGRRAKRDDERAVLINNNNEKLVIDTYRPHFASKKLTEY